MFLIDIPEAEYIVFEHGPFQYEQENCSVEQKIETAMANFDYAAANCCLDTSPGRIIRPIQNLKEKVSTSNEI